MVGGMWVVGSALGALDCSSLVLFEQSEEAWAVQASHLWYCLPVLASNVDLIYEVVKDTFNREVERRAAQISPEYAGGVWSIMRR